MAVRPARRGYLRASGRRRRRARAAGWSLLADVACALPPVTLPPGESEGRRSRWPSTGGWPSGPLSFWAPTLQLTGAVPAGLWSGRLQVVPSPGLAAVPKEELLDVQEKITAAADQALGAWREGAHDGLVLAVAVACWLGENLPGPAPHLRGAVAVDLGPALPLPLRLAGRSQDWDRRDRDEGGDEGRPRRRRFSGER